MKLKKLRKSGWQARVRYFKNYVIKTPMTPAQIRERISYYYQEIGKESRIEDKVKLLRADWTNSLRIVKSGKIPLRLLAFPEFISGGKIKQRRVKMLSEEFEELMDKGKINQAKKLVDKVIEFILTLWSYGVHEMTFKFYTEMGLMDGEIVLVDLGELTNDKRIVRKQILKGHKKLEDTRKRHHGEILDYYQLQIKRKLTIKNLNKAWKSRL